MFWKMQWSTVVLWLLCVLLVSLLWTRNKVNIRVEPLENMKNLNPKQALEKIGTMKENAKGSLNLADNHEILQDVILDYDHWAGFKLLNMLRDPENIERNLPTFNNLCEFKNNLNNLLAFLDKT